MNLKLNDKYIKEFESNILNNYKNKIQSKRIIKIKKKVSNEYDYLNTIKDKNINKNILVKKLYKRKNNSNRFKTFYNIIKNSIKKNKNFNVDLKKVINPNNKFYIIFSTINFILLTYSTIFFNFYISFYENYNKNLIIMTISLIIDFYLFIEIIINFFWAYKKDNLMIKNQKRIILNYLLKWFFIDLFLFFPFNLFDIKIDFKMNFLFKLSRNLRFIKIFRLKFIFIKLISFLKMPGYDRIIFSILFMLIVIHCIACLWIVIGNLDKNNSWINNFYNKDEFKLYLSSIYWSFYTVFSVGYGDIVAQNKYEYLYCIIIFIFSIIINSIIITSISRILNSQFLIKKRKEKINIMLHKLKKK